MMGGMDQIGDWSQSETTKYFEQIIINKLSLLLKNHEENTEILENGYNHMFQQWQ